MQLAVIENISDIFESPIFHNVDKNNSRSSHQMNFKYITLVAVIAATLVGTIVIAADSAYATKYHKNQAISQTNACGNGELPLDIFCQNIDSQVQGEENAVAIDGTQGPAPEE